MAWRAGINFSSGIKGYYQWLYSSDLEGQGAAPRGRGAPKDGKPYRTWDSLGIRSAYDYERLILPSIGMDLSIWGGQAGNVR